jgi:hypothetical protein
MERYAWNLKTLVEPYETAGFADPRWDASAKRALVEFAAIRAGVQTNNLWFEIIATNCAAAIQAGCRDPMIAYLAARYPTDASLTPRQNADELIRVAVQLKAASYPAVRKFYAVRRAAERFYQAYGRDADPAPVRVVGGCGEYLWDTLADPHIPVEEAFDICEEAMEAYSGLRDVPTYLELYRELEHPMFAAWPDDYRSWLVKGRAHIAL